MAFIADELQKGKGIPQGYPTGADGRGLVPPEPDSGGGGGGNPFNDPAPGGPEFRNIGRENYGFTKFVAPTAADMEQDPSYKFRMGEGQQALERSAAAKGLLRTGGTLKDIVGYGQNFASQEYGNVFDRAMKQAEHLRAQEETINQLKSGDWRERFRGEVQRAMAESKQAHDAWKARGDWAQPKGGGGGGGFDDPMPVWEE